jgi:dihydroorotate dehydrogenase
VLYSLLKPLLFRLEAERAHALVSGLLRAAGRTPLPGLLRALADYDDPILHTSCAGLALANPIGLAAGFDKRAALIGPMAALGFGHVEVGTVTPRPQPGNDRPRLFRLPEDGALINRLGFNSPGMIATAQNLREYRQNQEPRIENRPEMRGSRFLVPGSPIVGVNIGKNRTTPLERAAEDYRAAFVALVPLADYVTVNISSPNTPGLRRLHERAALEALLAELMTLNRRLPAPRPLFLKVSPDEPAEQLADVAAAGMAAGIAGLIATNTTLDRTGLRGARAGEAGGLSGRPLQPRARATIAALFKLTEGRLPIVGVGGVASAADAYAHIRAGASLVQLYTGLIYGGPTLIYSIKRGLADLLRRDSLGSVAEAVGAADCRL